MLPLGDCWEGVCRAEAGKATTPAGESLRTLCNLGYARGVCPRFPEAPGPDAVRFTLVAEEGERLRLYHVVECDHHPFAAGALECLPRSGEVAGPAFSPLVERQAMAYARSYLKRKRTAAG
jgi:hypothetical protein